MNIFDELGHIYDEIDKSYSITELESRRKGHHKKEAEYTRKRQLNDQAYFLFMFTRLEDRIRELSIILIDKKIGTITDWKYKRVWDILNRKKDDMFLLDRVALLVQLGGRDYNLIHNYYRQRNSIAHGGAFTITIDIYIVIADMKRLYNDLKKSI
jgi:hypothetical protein